MIHSEVPALALRLSHQKILHKPFCKHQPAGQITNEKMITKNPVLLPKRASKKPLRKGRELAKAKRRVGRPTAYRPEFCEMMVDFFDIPLEREVVVDVEDGQGNTVKETRIIVNPFPTFTRFASRIGVSRESLRNWASAKKSDDTPVKPEFFCAYARARDLQEALLIEGGMSGVYNYKFAILAARNILGWRGRVEHEVKESGSGATVNELDQIYEEGMCRAKEGRKQPMDSNVGL